MTTTTMKATIVVGVLLCIAISVHSQGGPVLRPYPVVFSAMFNETDWTNGEKTPVTRSVFLDIPNKRASISYATHNGEKWILIYKPQGGDPTAPASQGYTMFRINPEYPTHVPNNCMYMTGDRMSVAPFPEHWNKYGRKGSYRREVGTWFDLPADLVYNENYFIAELGVLADRWDSIRRCNLQLSGLGKVPCTTVMFSMEQYPLPLVDIRAFGAKNMFDESDSYKVRTYLSFTPSVQDSEFALPDNWQVKCGNADNNFVIEPYFPVTVFSNGEQTATLTFKLASPPIVGLGDVKVYLTPYPTWYYNCEDCVALGSPLIFTRDNWNVSQIVPLTYTRSGCSRFEIKSTGGGYDWLENTRSVVVYSCEGNKADKCTTETKCGSSSLLN